MTSPRCLLVICFGLVTWFWGIGGAFAQGNRPWDDFVWVDRRYKIEAISFKARDESGIDWWGSDEVFVETNDAEGYANSKDIENIDSGDIHRFDPARSCIVSVRPGIVVLGATSVCDDVGESAPLGFSVVLWERDRSLPFEFCHGVLPSSENEPPHETHESIGRGCAPRDDLLGRARIDLLAQDLEPVLPNVGDEYTETVVLIPCEWGVDLCATTYTSPDYTFTYRITRLPDRRLTLGSVLDEAMRRSGIRFDLEAIAAGLRALRAPRPRQVEPQTDNPFPKY